MKKLASFRQQKPAEMGTEPTKFKVIQLWGYDHHNPTILGI
jgi:hypothetical protein